MELKDEEPSRVPLPILAPGRQVLALPPSQMLTTEVPPNEDIKSRSTTAEKLSEYEEAVE